MQTHQHFEKHTVIQCVKMKCNVRKDTCGNIYKVGTKNTNLLTLKSGMTWISQANAGRSALLCPSYSDLQQM